MSNFRSEPNFSLLTETRATFAGGYHSIYLSKLETTPVSYRVNVISRYDGGMHQHAEKRVFDRRDVADGYAAALADIYSRMAGSPARVVYTAEEAA